MFENQLQKGVMQTSLVLSDLGNLSPHLQTGSFLNPDLWQYRDHPWCCVAVPDVLLELPVLELQAQTWRKLHLKEDLVEVEKSSLSQSGYRVHDSKLAVLAHNPHRAQLSCWNSLSSCWGWLSWSIVHGKQSTSFYLGNLSLVELVVANQEHLCWLSIHIRNHVHQESNASIAPLQAHLGHGHKVVAQDKPPSFGLFVGRMKRFEHRCTT